MMVASALGTIISLCIAYLYVYRRELFDRFFPGRKRGGWGDAFDGLIKDKKQGLGASDDSGKRSGMGVGESRVASTKSQLVKELEAMLSSHESGNSDKLIKAWLGYVSDIYRGGASELRPISKEWDRTKSSPLSPAFFKRIMIELFEQRAIFKVVSKQQLMEISTFNRLVVAVATLLLLMEDAQKGSRTLSRSLIKNQAHEKRVFLAIEYWVFLKTGASKNSLLAQLLKENHPVGRRLSSISYSKRVRLCLSTLTTEWAQVPDQKGLLASFVRVMDELASEEAKFKTRQSEEQRSKEKSREKARERARHKEKSQKRPRASSGSKREEYLSRLGLSNTSDFKSVRKAYMKLAMEKHPDRLMGSSPSEIEMKRAHEEFLKIQEAYQFLEKSMNGPKKAA